MNCFYVIYKEDWVPSGPGYITCVKRTAISVCLDKDIALTKIEKLNDQAYAKDLEDRLRYTYEEVKEIAIKDGQLVLSLN